VAPQGGVLVEPSATAYAGALRTLLDDATERARMSVAARRFASAERSLGVFHQTLADGLRLVVPHRS